MYAWSVAQEVRGTLEARDQRLLGVGAVSHLVGVPPLEVALAHHSLCTMHRDLMHACKGHDVPVGVHPDGAHQLKPARGCLRRKLCISSILRVTQEAVEHRQRAQLG